MLTPDTISLGLVASNVFQLTGALDLDLLRRSLAARAFTAENDSPAEKLVAAKLKLLLFFADELAALRKEERSAFNKEKGVPA